jgi:hypothetical protein
MSSAADTTSAARVHGLDAEYGAESTFERLARRFDENGECLSGIGAVESIRNADGTWRHYHMCGFGADIALSPLERYGENVVYGFDSRTLDLPFVTATPSKVGLLGIRRLDG